MLDYLARQPESWRSDLAQSPHHRLVETIHQARARVGDQRNFARLARFEAHSRSGRNVQAIPTSSLSIKGQSGIRFGEMIVTADLDRSVAGVCHSERDGRPILV